MADCTYKQHKKLHEALDELCACWLTKNKGSLLSRSTILDLMRWSANELSRLEGMTRKSIKPDAKKRPMGSTFGSINNQ